MPEIGYLASMIVGVFTTQIYIQSFAAARNLHAARRGAFASALIMPPMGLLGTAVGLSVRASGAEIQPDQVLSWFIMNSFPPLIGGLLWLFPQEISVASYLAEQTEAIAALDFHRLSPFRPPGPGDMLVFFALALYVLKKSSGKRGRAVL